MKDSLALYLGSKFAVALDAALTPDQLKHAYAAFEVALPIEVNEAALLACLTPEERRAEFAASQATALLNACEVICQLLAAPEAAPAARALVRQDAPAQLA